MSTPNDGGPAFPLRNGFCQPGMTLRDYFAAAAMQGMLVDTESRDHPHTIALFAYQQADAMLAKRAKTKGGSA
jgi:hypothetical protein